MLLSIRIKKITNLQVRHLFSTLITGMGWFLFLLPLGIYLWFSWTYSVNIPYWDDFTILSNLSNFISTNDLFRKLGILFSQANEHRVATIRLSFLAYYYLFGDLNFKAVNLFANLVWVATALFLSYQYMPKGKTFNPWYVLPLPYFLFSLAASECIIWAMGSAPYYFADFFVILFIWALVQDKRKLSYLFFTLAMFSFGSSMALYPLGCLFLVYKKRYRTLLEFLIYSTLIVFLYFLNYRGDLHNPNIYASLTNPIQIIEFIFTFIGAIIRGIEPAAIAMAGALIAGPVVFFILASLVEPIPEADFPVLVILFVVFAAGLAGMSRSNLGVYTALAPRYIPYSALFWSSAYALIFYIKPVKLKPFILTFALIIGLGLYGWGIATQNYTSLYENAKFQRINSITRYVTLGDIEALQGLYPNPILADQFLKTGELLGLYKFQTENLYTPEIYSIKGKNRRVVEGYVDNFDGGKIAGWAILPDENAHNSQIWILLKNGPTVYRLKTSPVARPDVSSFYHQAGKYDASGFESYLNIYAIPRGNYEIGIMVQNELKTGILWTSYQFNLP